MTTRVLLASRNTRKLAEMQRILGAVVPGLEIVGPEAVPDYAEPVEDAPTFAGNAMLKARAGACASGLATLADDSGLCVDALGGMPGVLSARWSGRRDGPREEIDQRNNTLLLDQLTDVPDERRRAHFVCAVALCLEDGDEIVVEGTMAGRIVRATRGEGGFGYDALFEADAEPGRTTAELTRAEKDRISHRGDALRRVAPLVRDVLA